MIIYWTQQNSVKKGIYQYDEDTFYDIEKISNAHSNRYGITLKLNQKVKEPPKDYIKTNDTMPERLHKIVDELKKFGLTSIEIECGGAEGNPIDYEKYEPQIEHKYAVMRAPREVTQIFRTYIQIGADKYQSHIYAPEWKEYEEQEIEKGILNIIKAVNKSYNDGIIIVR